MNDWLKLALGALGLVSSGVVMVFRVLPRQLAAEKDPRRAGLPRLQRQWEFWRPWYIYVLVVALGGTLVYDALVALKSR